ncbi:peptide-methionine (S)-S-oxide reductase MsrA [Romeria aff. gracilis LEGE 07310]|uniref:Peptide methionine sulfoxide reductase MsrA n=1 Tax=Vasconcelosia minhoensis LEGE 07310 TaxID=915328 RepID=A0A8J7AJW5_9CYAN|nr:peptide-methionine (S)-S-oxide reductase MsrA [Romeria gracilis]MBE9076014.1 peptide-methionine (S)-S-oxide reductase MsrA [Romeria aff. gracilis LEGE 07310]
MRIKQVFTWLSVLLLSTALLSCSSAEPSASVPAESASETAQLISADDSQLAEAVFAGGCFWCMEKPYDQLPGVVSTISGYTGGEVENPSYQQVSAGTTGHVEALQVRYDPEQISYEELLPVFWHNIDPVDDQGQFCDKGSQYRSAIFYQNEEQRQLAEASKRSLKASNKFDQPIATDLLPASEFYPAEDYHQNYYQTHPVRYKVYRFGCGRDQRLSELWGDEAPVHD